MCYLESGDYAKAEPLFRRAVQINEKVLGPDHGTTATTLDNLAWLHRKSGNYSKAETLNQQAVTIFRKSLGSEHPDTAVSPELLA